MGVGVDVEEVLGSHAKARRAGSEQTAMVGPNTVGCTVETSSSFDWVVASFDWAVASKGMVMGLFQAQPDCKPYQVYPELCASA